MIHNYSVSLKLIHFLLWLKGSHQSCNFETFECSGKNLPNSSCHFSNRKSAFLQILHHSSILWNITPLYFFSSKIIYFVQKERIEVQFWESSVFMSKFIKFLSFWNSKSVFIQIFYHSSVSLDITPLLAEILYSFKKRSQWKYKFDEISSEQSKVWTFALWSAPFVQII